MNIYKTNFPTEQEGKDYLLSIGVLVETDNEIVFCKRYGSGCLYR